VVAILQAVVRTTSVGRPDLPRIARAYPAPHAAVRARACCQDEGKLDCLGRAGMESHQPAELVPPSVAGLLGDAGLSAGSAWTRR
jgi:hypothetical protein